MPNRLATEPSSYLLQHAENPVDWYPWGAEALEKARREDRPILPSIGYSACLYRDTAEGIVAWLLREMRAPEGGVYSALDADSQGAEGKFYVWTTDQARPRAHARPARFAAAVAERAAFAASAGQTRGGHRYGLGVCGHDLSPAAVRSRGVISVARRCISVCWLETGARIAIHKVLSFFVEP